jgi:hypothetical protein
MVLEYWSCIRVIRGELPGIPACRSFLPAVTFAASRDPFFPIMKFPRLLLAAVFAASVLATAAFAAELSGTWKWTSVTATGPVEMTAVLLHKDGALTGTVTGRQGPADIRDASVNGGQVAFSVTRGTAGNKVVIKYSGKLAGDTITGTIERPGPKGEPTKLPWKATRAP